MAQVLEYALRLNDAAFTGPADRASASVRGLGGGLGDVTRHAGGVTSLGSSFAGLAGKMGLVGGVAGGLVGAFSALKSAVRGAADFESTSVAFETLIGDAQQAKQTLGELKKLGAETPFEFPELANAGRMLIAFGESASTVTDTLRMVGDVSAGIQAPIGEIAEIYGKARTAGTLFAEDINQLTGRGIPVISEFAKQLGVSESEVKQLGSEGKITFNMLEVAFQNLTQSGGKFADMMKKQSGTMNGLWSTLKDNVGEVLRTIGAPINDALKPMLESAIARAGMLNTVITAAIAKGKIGESLANALSLGAKLGVNATLDFINTLPSRAAAALTTLGEAIAAAMSGSFDEAGRLISSFNAQTLRFDTSNEINFFKELTREAEGAAKATQTVADNVQKAAAAGQAAATGGAAPAAAAASAGGSRGRANERYDATGRRLTDGRRKIIGAKGDGRPDFQGLDGFYRNQIKDEMPFNQSGGAGYARGQAVPRFSSSISTSTGSLSPRTGPSNLDQFHQRNKTQGLAPAFSPQLPSPGAERRTQDRKDATKAAASAPGGSSGTHPLAAAVKDIQTKLSTLAVAT